ncbi:glycoside hydrolase family 95 protein [Duganella sp. sic0402]|uniref:glycoside hydrolase family 95 protein n=1 Tax=Duganella sp. sic0402 TaxID=2854786 RepID=UPI001C44F301|nr:glycoside hydrolase family 95 protein [Duganella sp. sic0402]MBV7534229.1 glycoside hydrolase family 95 protein [Duganella sp. sic0402]
METTRRSFIITAGLAAAFPGLAKAAVQATTRGAQESLSLWYEQAAAQWVEALPVGNGRLGAMCFGRIAQERIQLNEDTLFAGGPYDPNNPLSLAALPQVRALIDQARFSEAAQLISSSMMGVPKTQMPYGAAGDLLLDFHGLSGGTAYRRWLDLDTAISATRFSDGKTQYKREVFASAADQVIAIRLSATNGLLNFDLSYRHPLKANYGVTDYTGAKATAAAAPMPWDYREPLRASERPSSLSVRADGADALLIEGRNIDAAGIPAALRYAVRVQALGDGSITPRDDRIEVRGASTVTLLVAAATSYVNYADVSGDPVGTVRAQTAAAAAKPYARLRSAHVHAHQRLFRRLSLRLGSGAPDPRPTNQRIAVAEQQPDAGLAALYVQYGRYLLLSSSRPGSQPANLQGLWNEGVNPPWGGKYTININTQMNYWPAESANLGECVEPLLRMVEDLSVTGAVTASKSYGARGWMAHHNTDLWRAAAPIDGPLWGMWPCGGAWLCQALWDHYDYSPDSAYLRRIYPLLKGASLFFIDTLVEDPQGRGWVTSPSISPENEHHKGVATCAGPAMDRQIIRDLFGWTLKAHALLGDSDAAFAAELEAKRARLPPDRVGAQGQLQEWLEDWDAGAPEQKHRHVSHLYGVYPSEQINVRDTPELVAAAKVTLNTRGDKSTGWATAWRLALWTRMGEGERAYAILQGLLGPERTYPNMFDAHPPFQIDGNFGGTAAILEMLVQSWGGEIRLLAALPQAWPEGSVRGVRARGGVELDLDWSQGKLKQLLLRGQPGQKVKVRHGEHLTEMTLDAKGRARMQ